MTREEIDYHRWNALVKLTDAVQAHRASCDTGLPTDGQLDVMDGLEDDYAALHYRHRALLVRGFSREEEPAA
jgi:hypothetical protein